MISTNWCEFCILHHSTHYGVYELCPWCSTFDWTHILINNNSGNNIGGSKSSGAILKKNTLTLMGDFGMPSRGAYNRILVPPLRLTTFLHCHRRLRAASLLAGPEVRESAAYNIRLDPQYHPIWIWDIKFNDYNVTEKSTLILYRNITFILGITLLRTQTLLLDFVTIDCYLLVLDKCLKPWVW